MATPLRSSVPSTRVKRATSVLTITSPAIGSRSNSWSNPSRPRGVASTMRLASTPTTVTRASSHQ